MQFTAHEPSKVETLRQSYIERETRPTYEELAEEFSIPLSTIKGYASSESWVAMRLAHQERLAEKSDALGIVLRATKIDQRVVEKFADAIISIIEKLTRTAQDIDDTRAPATRAQTINTLSFAVNNLANASKTLGIIGMPKELSGIGKEDNGRWNPQLLSQINVTVQNLAAAAKAEQPTEKAAPAVADFE